MSSAERHRVARPAQYTCRGSATSTSRSARVYVARASDTTGNPATASACAKPANPTSSGISPGQQSVQPGPGDSLQVLVVLDDRTERRRRGLRVENVAIEFTQRPCPVQGFGHSGRLDQFHATQGVPGAGDLVGEGLRDAGDAAFQNRDLGGQIGMLEPVVQAAALERV